MAIPPLYVNVLSARQKRTYFLLFSLWLLSTIIFWAWWLQPNHWVTTNRMVFSSLILSWSTIMPLYFFLFLFRMKTIRKDITIPTSKRLAMVVTKAPSEPFSVVKKTLLAMIAQEPKHDNWLADEQPTEEVYAWCKEHNVSISTRFGVEEYHQKTWPRRTKCKEGNLSYFYDMYGYEAYDFVVQLDADHIPEPGYLEAMIRPFADPKVGYVSAPSICDLNEHTSWAARGRLYAESTLHGPLQAGYTNGWAPLCIGSHYAIRTKALKEIGGLGPELAEDHSTSLLFNAHGWRGTHALDAIAHGDGPQTFADAMTQEFQWSRSLIVLLMTVTPKVLHKLPFRLQFQFLFAQLWYPSFALLMASSMAIPVYAIISGAPIVNVAYYQFFLVFSLPTITALLIVYWLKKQELLRPTHAKVISWEVLFFQFARWPWVLWAVISALLSTLTKKHVEFRVTPKGQKVSKWVPLRVLFPYTFLVIAPALFALLYRGSISSQGYYFFIILNSITYLFLIASVMYQQYQAYEYEV